MKNKSIIAIDIDDVLSENATFFTEFSNKEFNTNLKPEDYIEDWSELWNVDNEELDRRVNKVFQSENIARYGVIQKSREVLSKLKDKYKLIILTSRRRSIEEDTKKWIEKNYPNIFDDIIFAGFFDNYHKDRYKMTKATLAKDIKADFLIDDQLKHIEAVASIGIKGLLFGDYKWNKREKLHEDIIRVRDWNEVFEYFKKNNNI